MGRPPGLSKWSPPYAINVSLCLHQPEQKFRLLYVFVYTRCVIALPAVFRRWQRVLPGDGPLEGKAGRRNYLVFQYDIEPDRIETVGLEKTQLLDSPSKPEDGINRRVQVINLGEGPGSIKENYRLQALCSIWL